MVGSFFDSGLLLYVPSHSQQDTLVRRGIPVGGDAARPSLAGHAARYAGAPGPPWGRAVGSIWTRVTRGRYADDTAEDGGATGRQMVAQ